MQQTKRQTSLNCGKGLADGAKLRSADNYKYLRSTISADESSDYKITSTIQNASQTLGKLRVKVLRQKGITLSTELKGYIAVLIS